MSYSVIFHSRVKFEVHDSFLWYEDQSEGLGQSFLNEIENAKDVLEEAPTVWPKNSSGVFKYLLKRFPYIVFYKVYTNNVVVYAIAHASCKPGYWLSRTYQSEN